MPAGVEHYHDLDSAEAAGAGALDRRRPLFERLAWFRLVAAHCPPPGRLLVLRADGDGDESGGGSAAWLFLAVRGNRAGAYSCWYSLRSGLIGDPAAGVAIARDLRDRGLATVTLAPVAAPEPLAHAFRKAGWRVSVSAATASWQAAPDGGFDAYWQARPARLRNTAERRAKAAGLVVEIHRRFEAAAWADYEAVYAASWKPSEGSPAFLRALAEQEGAAGTLRLGIARKDGRAVAAQLWLIEDGTATIHKLAYRDDAKALSPGTVLGMAMFRAAIDEDRVTRIDYGTGDESYKANWMDERYALWRIEAFNPATPAGLAAAGRAALSRLVRRLRSR